MKYRYTKYTGDALDDLDLEDLVAKLSDLLLASGFGHPYAMNDDDRTRFVSSLHGVVVPGGRYHMLCFSDLQPGDWGPRRVSQDEIRSTFSDGWQVASIDAATLDITISPEGARAWLATVVRS